MNPDAAIVPAPAAAASGTSSPESEGKPVFTPTTTVMPYDVLTPAQAAAYLQVGEDIVLQEADAGRLPGQKLGGQWRFLRMAITEWLHSGQQSASANKTKSMLSVIGAFKGDDTLEAMVEEIYRQRKNHPVEE